MTIPAMKDLKQSMKFKERGHALQCDNDTGYTREEYEYDWHEKGMSKFLFTPSMVPVTSKGLKFICDAINFRTTIPLSATEKEMRSARARCSCKIVKKEDPAPSLKRVDFPLVRWAPGMWM